MHILFLNSLIIYVLLQYILFPKTEHLVSTGLLGLYLEIK